MSRSLVEEEGRVREERRRSEKEMKNCNKRRNTKNRKYHSKLNRIARIFDLVGGAATRGVSLRMREEEVTRMASSDSVLVEDALYQQAR